MVDADKQAQVYETGRIEGGFHAEGIMGCVYGSSHQFFVGDAGPDSASGGASSSVEQMVGTLAAVATSSYENYGQVQRDEVSVIELRTGRLMRHSATGPPEPAHDYESAGAGPVTSLVLRPNGDIAWIAATPYQRLTSAGKDQVYTLEASGQRMVASGNEIDPLSLALADETIYWTQAGKPDSAPLK